MLFSKKITQKSWFFLSVIYLLELLLNSLINLVIFKQNWFKPLYAASNGLIQSTLLVSLGAIIIVVFLNLILLGKISPADLGLDSRKIGQAIIVILGLWTIAQLVGLVSQYNASGRIALSTMWFEQPLTTTIGFLLAQIFGNALHEEIVYRGFFLPQIHGRITTCKRSLPRWVPIFLSVLISQFLFSLAHVPNRIFNGHQGWAIFQNTLWLLGMGVLFSLVYIITDNLYIAVGVHSLFNFPTALFSSSSVAGDILMVLTILLMIVWVFVQRKHNTRTSSMNKKIKTI